MQYFIGPFNFIWPIATKYRKVVTDHEKLPLIIHIVHMCLWEVTL